MDTSNAEQKALYDPSGKSFLEIFGAGEKALAPATQSSSTEQTPAKEAEKVFSAPRGSYEEYPIERRRVFVPVNWWIFNRLNAAESAFCLQARNCFKSS